MPKPQPSHRETATDLLAEAFRADPGKGEPAVLRQDALIHALLAVADETAAVREHVESIVEALKSRDGVDVGTSLYYISDWLKDIAERR